MGKTFRTGAFGLLVFLFAGGTAIAAISPRYEPANTYARSWQRVAVWNSNLLPPAALISNHHLLASDQMAGVFALGSSTRIRRVILISPDHFVAGHRPVSTTSQNWQTDFGLVRADQASTEALRAELNLPDESWSMVYEHGIYNLLPMVHRYFPNARIIPITIKPGSPDYWVDRLSAWLRQLNPVGTVVIGSFDFSHTKTLAVSNAQDARSLHILRISDPVAALRADVDSPEGLSIILQYTHSINRNRFVFHAHNNSALIVGQPELENTTSYLTGLLY